MLTKLTEVSLSILLRVSSPMATCLPCGCPITKFPRHYEVKHLPPRLDGCAAMPGIFVPVVKIRRRETVYLWSPTTPKCLLHKVVHNRNGLHVYSGYAYLVNTRFQPVSNLSFFESIACVRMR